MHIFKQNRWVMPLFGVILVCFSAIILLLPSQGRSGERDKVHMGRLQSPRLSSAPETGDMAVKTANRTGGGIGPCTRSRHSPAGPAQAVHRIPGTPVRLKPALAAEWLSAKEWNRKGRAASAVTVRAEPSQPPQ